MDNNMMGHAREIRDDENILAKKTEKQRTVGLKVKDSRKSVIDKKKRAEELAKLYFQLEKSKIEGKSQKKSGNHSNNERTVGKKKKKKKSLEDTQSLSGLAKTKKKQKKHLSSSDVLSASLSDLEQLLSSGGNIHLSTKASEDNNNDNSSSNEEVSMVSCRRCRRRTLLESDMHLVLLL
jgi:hypothetical protein